MNSTKIKYYFLRNGDIIQEGDEVYCYTSGGGIWKPVRWSIGQIYKSEFIQYSSAFFSPIRRKVGPKHASELF